MTEPIELTGGHLGEVGETLDHGDARAALGARRERLGEQVGAGR